MARGVDQMEQVVLSVLCVIDQLDGIQLDGDPPFPLQVHGVQNLIFHLPLLHGIRHFQDPVRQSGLAVVDMGDDGKVAYIFLIHSVIPHSKQSVLLLPQAA